eukprot:Protomagalhaensia_wolfi_Nauph_80__2881@NODE_2977_length_928_cov_58_964004_g2334_i0_p1_GENE_NODE_2977_length_928_cov_58_964004_g2334_i0NODE_2977_length_928_cov_58_964004_g2334_i0_p1_ORF_typecomplete_len143_score6_53_NODE_2977_length_928_cov_58_964004_g2334_i0269697
MSGYRGVHVPVGKTRRLISFLFALTSTSTYSSSLSAPLGSTSSLEQFLEEVQYISDGDDDVFITENLRCRHCGENADLSSRLTDHFLKRKWLCPAAGYMVRDGRAHETCTCGPLEARPEFPMRPTTSTLERWKTSGCLHLEE